MDSGRFRKSVSVSLFGFPWGYPFRVTVSVMFSVNHFLNLLGVSDGVVFFISLFSKTHFSLFSNRDIHFPGWTQDVLESWFRYRFSVSPGVIRFG